MIVKGMRKLSKNLKLTKPSNLNDRNEPESIINAEDIMNNLTVQELNENLEKGYADILAGRTQPAKEVFAEIRRDYNY